MAAPWSRRFYDTGFEEEAGRSSLGWCFVPIIPGLPVAHSVRECRGAGRASVFISSDITFKMVEYFRHWGNVERSIVLRDYYRFLIPFPVFSCVYPNHKRRLLRPESSLAAGPASLRWDRRYYNRPPGNQSSIQNRLGPIELCS